MMLKVSIIDFLHDYKMDYAFSLMSSSVTIGVANIPNQSHAKVVLGDPVSFNVLLMGEMSSGKTALFNRLFQTEVFENNLSKKRSTTEVRVRERIVQEGPKLKMRISLVDVPLLGHSVSKSEGYSY